MAIASPTYTPLPVSPDLLIGDKIQSDDSRFGLIWINPARMSGVPCFFGTRVPIQTLFDYIEGGDTIDEFIDAFLPITREHVLAVLEMAKTDLLHGSIAP
jgi:uncharacterized protein (DUF433 family)